MRILPCAIKRHKKYLVMSHSSLLITFFFQHSLAFIVCACVLVMNMLPIALLVLVVQKIFPTN